MENVDFRISNVEFETKPFAFIEVCESNPRLPRRFLAGTGDYPVLLWREIMIPTWLSRFAAPL